MPLDAAGHTEELESAYQKALSGTESVGEGTESVFNNIGDAKAKFKEVWPDVKNGLELLRTLSGMVPGVGAIVTTVIGVVITAGEAAFKAVS